MFLTSFNSIRQRVIDETHIDNFLHLGPHTFDELSGEVVQNSAFVLTNGTIDNSNSSVFYRLTDGQSCKDKESLFLKQDYNIIFNIPQTNFCIFPENTLGYWATAPIYTLFKEKNNISNVAYARVGMFTGNNDRFLRIWWEIDLKKSLMDCKSDIISKESHMKWFPYNKGGGYRKWYGNNELVVNYYNYGYEIFELAKAEKRNCQLKRAKSTGTGTNLRIDL